MTEVEETAREEGGTDTREAGTVDQGLKLVHFSGHRKLFLGDRRYLGVIQGGGVRWKGVSGGVLGIFVCQKRLRLSRNVDKCTPLPWMRAMWARMPSTRAVYSHPFHLRERDVSACKILVIWPKVKCKLANLPN